MARYKQLTCPEQIHISSGKGERVVEIRLSACRGAEPAVLVDLCLSWILTIGRSGTGHPITPLRLDLSRPAGYREISETHYRCRVKFKAGRNALVFRATDLERPFVTHNAELLAMLGPQLPARIRGCELLLSRLSSMGRHFSRPVAKVRRLENAA